MIAFLFFRAPKLTWLLPISCHTTRHLTSDLRRELTRSATVTRSQNTAVITQQHLTAASHSSITIIKSPMGHGTSLTPPEYWEVDACLQWHQDHHAGPVCRRVFSPHVDGWWMRFQLSETLLILALCPLLTPLPPPNINPSPLWMASLIRVVADLAPSQTSREGMTEGFTGLMTAVSGPCSVAVERACSTITSVLSAFCGFPFSLLIWGEINAGWSLFFLSFN